MGRESLDDRVFAFVNYSLLGLVLFLVVYPLYYTIIVSFSEPALVARNEVTFMPKGFTLDSYRNVFENSIIWTGYMNTIYYTAAGTIFNILLTIPCAYAFSKKGLPGRRVLIFIFTFTMYFSGGMIPTYILVKSLGLPNTPFVMIILGGVSVYNMIVARAFFESAIPEELYEAARIDGYSEIRIFFKIAIPLAAPIIAVITLYYSVGHWNEFFSALIYLTKERLYPLQLVLRNILLENQAMKGGFATDEEMAAMVKRLYTAETMKYALIFIASFPVLCAYPFVQKYFVKGALVGAVKG
jgi:putative aldouronate transport system permease protein